MSQKRISNLSISLAVIQVILVTFSLVALALFVVGWGIGVDRVEVLKDFMSYSTIIMICILKITAVLLIFILFLIVISWLSKEEQGVTIYPFEVVPEGNNINGEAISHLIVAEMERIRQIHDFKYECIKPIEVEKLNLSYFSSPRAPTKENLCYNIAELGTVGAGNVSISIGSLLIALKGLWPWGSTRCIITGSLQKYGSIISLVACQEHQGICAWEVSRMIKPHNNLGDEYIPSLIKDLSFKIAHGLSFETSAKTWKGLKYYTEALDSYRQYNLTNYMRDLERARKNCIRAAYVEKDYPNPFGLLYNLGVAYVNVKKYPMAERSFRHISALKPDFEDIKNFLGISLLLQKRYNEAITCFDDQICINPQDFRALYLKGISYREMKDYEKALKCFDKAIEKRKPKDYAEAWFEKGVAFSNLNDNKNAIKCYKEATKINPNYSDAWHNMGRAYKAINNPDEHKRCINKSLLIHHLSRAKIYFKSRDNKSDIECEKIRKLCEKIRKLIEEENEYTRACFEAICGSADNALKLLSTALENKQQPLDWIRKDPFLESIHNHPRFDSLLKQYE